MLDEVIVSIVIRPASRHASLSYGCRKCKGEYWVRTSDRCSIDSRLTSNPKFSEPTSGEILQGPGHDAGRTRLCDAARLPVLLVAVQQLVRWSAQHTGESACVVSTCP